MSSQILGLVNLALSPSNHGKEVARIGRPEKVFGTSAVALVSELVRLSCFYALFVVVLVEQVYRIN